jgi:hypothetical protein
MLLNVSLIATHGSNSIATHGSCSAAEAKCSVVASWLQ